MQTAWSACCTWPAGWIYPTASTPSSKVKSNQKKWYSINTFPSPTSNPASISHRRCRHKTQTSQNDDDGEHLVTLPVREDVNLSKDTTSKQLEKILLLWEVLMGENFLDNMKHSALQNIKILLFHRITHNTVASLVCLLVKQLEKIQCCHIVLTLVLTTSKF